MRRVAASTICAAAVLTTLWIVAAPAPAAAQSGCSGSINGSDSRSHRSPGDALPVGQDDAVSVEGVVAGANTVAYTISLEFAGFSWDVASDEADGDRYRDQVAVDDYATHGTGLYKVIGKATSDTGVTCTEFMYVDVEGGSLLGTTAGIAGAGAVAVGLAGTGIAAARARRAPDLDRPVSGMAMKTSPTAGREINEAAVGDAVGNFLEQQAGADEPRPKRRRRRADGDAEREAVVDWIEDPNPFGCISPAFWLPLVVVAAGLTVKAMASDAFHQVVALIGRGRR